jgi:predicted carbohydrate-binding protein with CBM5 and CBM33 domain
MCIKKYATGLFLLFLAMTVSAHGLMESPASRNWFCGAVTKPDHVINGTAQYPICGTAFAYATNQQAGYSFMSVLNHHLGASAIPPKNVCSADSETWSGAVTPWDAPMAWPTNPMSAGKQDIVWNISWGPHFSDSMDFKYWISKSSFVFSPTRALSWSDFEATPFCVLNYNDATPNANPDVIPDTAAAKFTTKCTVPARSGHHVIYGEWGRTPPTYERFHGCIDVSFGGVSNPVVSQITATPSNTSVTGAATIALSGSASQGTNLTYLWAIESSNNSLYSLSSTSAVNTTLTLQNPQAQTTFTVRLTVSNGTNSNSSTMTFTHMPSVSSSWVDMGALTTTAQTLAVGSRVSVRMVNSSGVDTYFPTTPLTITSANSGSTAWPYALAQAINAQNGNIQVGVLSNNLVTPAQHATNNRIYAVSPTTYTSAFLTVVAASSSSSISSRSSSASLSSSRSSVSSSRSSSRSSSVSSSRSSSTSRSSSISSSSRSSASSTSGTANTCTYVVVNEWATGFNAAIHIKNNRTTAINGWSVDWTYTDGSRVTSFWSAKITGSNPYNAINETYNSNIPPGQTVQFGFLGSKNGGAAQVPVVTGAVCN